MNRNSLNDSYVITSLAFIAIILAILVYSLIFSAGGRKHPVPSGAEVLTGELSTSSGMSRSFSEIVRFNFREAKRFNPYGPRIFAFFAIQLFLRTGAVIMMLFFNVKYRQQLILVDVPLSVMLFVFFFWPFIVLTVQQLI